MEKKNEQEEEACRQQQNERADRKKKKIEQLERGDLQKRIETIAGDSATIDEAGAASRDPAS